MLRASFLLITCHVFKLLLESTNLWWTGPLTGCYHCKKAQDTKGDLLQHDNTRKHICWLASNIVKPNRFKDLPHLTFLPDLAPSDYFLFQNLKKELTSVCMHLKSDDDFLTSFKGKLYDKPLISIRKDFWSLWIIGQSIPTSLVIMWWKKKSGLMVNRLGQIYKDCL